MAGIELFKGIQLSGLASGTLTTLLMIFLGVVVVILLYFGNKFYQNKKKYREYHCVIWEKDAFGNVHEKNDNAGIFVDGKTNQKLFWLEKGAVGLKPDDVPYVMKGGSRKVYLAKIGLKNYYFIKPEWNASDFTFSVSEEDVNWAIVAYEKNKNVFNLKNALLQYLPMIMFVISVLAILVIFIYFFKQFPVLRDVALALREAAAELAKARAGQVIVT